MKNKKLIYILFPAVIIVWGLVIFRIINYTGKSDDYIIPAKSVMHEFNQKALVDSFTIMANYPDPFKRSVSPATESKQIDDKKTNIANPVNRNRNIKRIRWPEIQYGGIVRNNEQNEMIAILNIDNKNCLLMAGDVKFDVKIVQIYNDSITLEFQEEVKTIIKGKN